MTARNRLARRLVSWFPDRFDGFWAGFRDKYDRTAFIAEGRAHLVGQILFILLREEFLSIDEKEKGGRGLFDLCGVEELEAMAPRADRLPAFDGILQSAI